MPQSKISNPKSKTPRRRATKAAPAPPPASAPAPPADPTLESLLSGHPSLQPEIDVLRQNMAWIQAAFTRARSFDDRLKLCNAWGDASAHLARLLRVQRLLQVDRPNELEQFISSMIREVNAEWDAKAAQDASIPADIIASAASRVHNAPAVSSSPFPPLRRRRTNKY